MRYIRRGVRRCTCSGWENVGWGVGVIIKGSMGGWADEMMGGGERSASEEATRSFGTVRARRVGG